MPANLTPQYFEAERKYRESKTPHDKLEALKLMLAEIPKHKGTEKLQADIKRKIAKSRSEVQKAEKHGAKIHSYYVRKEGAGQIAMVGPPNTGKSSLVGALTNAKPEIANYPFSTREPCPGMMHFENIQVQLLDLPPVSAEYMEYWVPNLIRTADAVALIISLLAPDPLDQVESTREILRQKKLEFVSFMPEESENISISYKKTIIFANQHEPELTADVLQLVREMFENDYPVFPIQTNNNQLLEQFKRVIFSALEIVRVYSKPPGKEIDLNEPFILKKGSTLQDLAAAVHREFVDKLRFARVWGTDKYDGQRINRDYELMDGDVVELHV